MKTSDDIEEFKEKTNAQLADEYYEKGNYSEAFEQYKQAAEQGDARAQYNIGLFYYKGISPVEQNYTVAIFWFEKAASQRFSNALYKLGKMHEDGIGVEQDFIEAYVLYRKASFNGHKKAKEKAFKILKGVCDKAKQKDADSQKKFKELIEKEPLIKDYYKSYRMEIVQKTREKIQQDLDLNEGIKEAIKMATGEELSNRCLYTTRTHYEQAFENEPGASVTISINPIQIKKGFVTIHVGKYTTFSLEPIQFNEFLECIPKDTIIEYKIVKTRTQKITNSEKILLNKAKEAVRKGDSLYLFVL